LGNNPCASILDCIGNTPLLEMNVQYENETWHFFAKLEFMNPTGSVKDRIAKYLIEQAEKRGELKSDSVIVEATSGNTGISLAMVAAVKGYKVIIVMPEHMSRERIKIMNNLGAEICLTPTEGGFTLARVKAERIAAQNPQVFLPRQFQNPDNTECHYKTTGREIVEQMGKREIDAFVAGVGTGGTLMGVGQRLREVNPSSKLIAVEPAEAAVITGSAAATVNLLPHKIVGIGDGFIPELLDVNKLDWTEVIKSDEAVEMAKEIGRRYGMMVGISSGANVLATINVLKKLGKSCNVVTIFPDRAERYFSTDLYESSREAIIRQCWRNCENHFCEIKTQIA